MSSNNYKLELILKNNNGKEIDLVYSVYELLESAGESAPILLKKFLDSSPLMNQQEKKGKVLISDSIFRERKDKVALFVDDWLESTIKDSPSENEFYRRLWEFIQDNKSFRGKNNKIIALYLIWMDPRIPYFKLKPGLKMSNEVFSKICEEIDTELLKARFTLYSRYEQRPEEASVLLSLMNELESQEEKAVLLAYIIRSVEIRTLKQLVRTKGSFSGI